MVLKRHPAKYLTIFIQIFQSIISIIYTLVRILENSMSGEDPKPLKVLVKDTFLPFE